MSRGSTETIQQHLAGNTSNIAPAKNQDRQPRKILVGVVMSDKMNKTRRVEISRSAKHTRYKKYFKRRTVCHVHDETNNSHVGDTVEIMETRPLSRTKHWRLVRVITHASQVGESDSAAKMGHPDQSLPARQSEKTLDPLLDSLEVLRREREEDIEKSRTNRTLVVAAAGMLSLLRTIHVRGGKFLPKRDTSTTTEKAERLWYENIRTRVFSDPVTNAVLQLWLAGHDALTERVADELMLQIRHLPMADLECFALVAEANLSYPDLERFQRAASIGERMMRAYTLSAWFAELSASKSRLTVGDYTLCVRIAPVSDFEDRIFGEERTAKVRFGSFFQADTVQAIALSPCGCRIVPLYTIFPWPPRVEEVREFVIAASSTDDLYVRVELLAQNQLVASLDIAAP